MESAAPECQSLQTADKLPEKLSASMGKVVNRIARTEDGDIEPQRPLNETTEDSAAVTRVTEDGVDDARSTHRHALATRSVPTHTQRPRPGIDGVRMQAYEAQLGANLEALLAQFQGRDVSSASRAPRIYP
jgi:hypothetical protein